jgi:excisionase family DNA binding protein
MTISQAAKYLRCSEPHLMKLMEGQIPGSPILAFVRKGRRISIGKKALHDWLWDLESFQRQDQIRRQQAKGQGA